jgi:hypothetical protein
LRGRVHAERQYSRGLVARLLGGKTRNKQVNKAGLPLHCNWQLPGPGYRLHDYIGFLDTALGQLALCAVKQWRDNALVPARVDNTDAQGAAIMLLRFWALDRSRSHGFALLAQLHRGSLAIADETRSLALRGIELAGWKGVGWGADAKLPIGISNDSTNDGLIYICLPRRRLK